MDEHRITAASCHVGDGSHRATGLLILLRAVAQRVRVPLTGERHAAEQPAERLLRVVVGRLGAEKYQEAGGRRHDGSRLRHGGTPP